MELQAALEVVASDKYWFQASLAGSRRDGISQEFMHAEYRALFFSGVQDDLWRSSFSCFSTLRVSIVSLPIYLSVYRYFTSKQVGC